MTQCELRFDVLSGDSLQYPPIDFSDLSIFLEKKLLAQCGSCVLLLGPNSVGKQAAICQTLREIDVDRNLIIIKIFGDTLNGIQIVNLIANSLSVSENLNSDFRVTEFERKVPLNCDELGSMISSHNKNRNQTQKIVFIIEHFHKFCIAHPQILYTLLELSCLPPESSTLVHLFLTTNRHDVMETLEKRIKSRLSQDIFYLSFPSTIQVYTEVIRSALTADLGAIYHTDFLPRLFENKQFSNLLEIQYAYSRDPSILFPIFIDVILALSDTLPLTKPSKGRGSSLPVAHCDSFVKLFKFYLYREHEQRVESLSASQLCILVAFKRASERRTGLASTSPKLNWLTFEEIYLEVTRGFRLSSRPSDGELFASKYPRPILRAAIESLSDLNGPRLLKKTVSKFNEPSYALRTLSVSSVEDFVRQVGALVSNVDGLIRLCSEKLV